ncbi:MAG: ATP-binding protein [Pseudomonadota bacterium]
MSARLGLSWRLGLILLVALVALWLAGIAAFYISEGARRAAALPTPGALAALAKAVESTEDRDRALILTAMQTATRSVRVERTPLAEATLPALWPADAATLDGYVRALNGRPLSVIPQTMGGPFGGRFASAFNQIEFRVGLAGGETLVVRSSSPVPVAPIGVPMGFGAGLVAVLIALGALILLNREIRPLARLAAALDAFDPNDAAQTTPQVRARSPEIRALVAAFGRLHDRLKTLTQARMALIGGVQHDVRSFATRLRLRVERIPDEAERARAEADIEDIVALLDDALLASRAGADALDQELLELFPIVEVEVADRLAAGGDASLVIDEKAKTATLLGDRLALRRIVANIIGNALRYGAVARVEMKASDDEIVLTVEDDGPGIPPDKRAALLEPFTRLEESRSRSTGGSGLGLAIASSLVAAHGGSLSIDGASSGGARVIFNVARFQSN